LGGSVKGKSPSGLVTTIQVRPETRDRLKDLGKKGDTYDEIINRLIDFWLEMSPKQVAHFRSPRVMR